MEEEKVIEQQEVKVDEVVIKEEVKIETNEPVKEEVKEVDNKYSDLELRLKALEEDNKLKDQELNSQKIKNSILEKIEDKDLQKEVLESGLVKNAEDIEKVIKILEISKSLGKSKFNDGYKPQDTVQGDLYQQAQAKGNVFEMIKQRMNKQ